MNRGSRRWNIFLDDHDRLAFLRLLANTCELHNVRVIAYCLMGNHFHLLLHCPKPALSDAMHSLGSRYAMIFNARHGFDGPLCRSRFTSVEVTDNEQLLTTVRYIHRNPLDLDPENDLAAYQWSSHAAFLGWAQTPNWLFPADVLDQFGPNTAKFQHFVEASLPSDGVQNVSASIRPPNLYSDPGRVISTSTPADVQRAVARAAHIDVRLVQQPLDRKQKQARAAALLLCVDELLLAPKTLTDTFGFSTPGALRTTLCRARQQFEPNGAIATLMTQARTYL